MIAKSQSALVAAIALTLTSAAAIAQTKDALEEVTIVATRQVVTAGHTASGRPVEMVQLSRVVSYSDINIGTHSGAMVLETRIKDAAKEVCKELERLVPSGTSKVLGSGSCVDDATKDGMAQAKVAIAAAESAPAKK